MKKLIIGLALDTVFTEVCYKEQNCDKVYTLRDLDGFHDTIPSAIFLPKVPGGPFFGHEAFTLAHVTEGELISNLFDWSFINEETLCNRMKYVELFLTYVQKLLIRQTTGIDCDEWKVLFNYPPNWSSKMVSYVKEAISRVGFGLNIHAVDNVRALAYKCLKHVPGNLEHQFFYILNYGMNHTEIVIGRFNRSLTETTVDNFVTYPSYPVCHGERNVDDNLKKYVLQFVNMHVGNVSEIFDDYAYKQWKESAVVVFLNQNRRIFLPSSLSQICRLVNEDAANKLASFILDRDKFEKITFWHWENIKMDILKAMNKYNQIYKVTSNDIDIAFITGCEGCRWYRIRELFTKDLFEQSYFRKIAQNPSLLIVDNDSNHGLAETLCLMG